MNIQNQVHTKYTLNDYIIIRHDNHTVLETKSFRELALKSFLRDVKENRANLKNTLDNKASSIFILIRDVRFF